MEREEQHQQNLEEYRQSFSQAVEQEFPLSDLSLGQLRDWQQSLQLSDEEVLKIEQPIIEQKEGEARKQEEERIRQQEEAEEERRQREETERLSPQQSANRLEHQKAERLREQNEAERRRQQPSTTVTPPTTISRKQFLQWAGWGSAGVVTAVVASQIFKEQSLVAQPKYIKPTEDGEKFVGWPLWTVQFETVTVDARGEVVKRDSERQAKFFKEDLGNGVNLELVSIPGGKFMMGSPPDEKGRAESESPQQEVTVSPFFMGKFPVTQAQWQKVMGNNPSSFKGDELPVESVSWSEAEEFCQRLSSSRGGRYQYRLPTEAEWEYACRAGTNTPFHFGETITTDLANYEGHYTYAQEPKGEERRQTTPVGSFPPNAFGLYDLHGNVWEWCEDDWHKNYQGAPNDGSAWRAGSGSLKVIRGGSWVVLSVFCRSAFRVFSPRDDRDDSLGFRVVCVAPRTA